MAILLNDEEIYEAICSTSWDDCEGNSMVVQSHLAEHQWEIKRSIARAQLEKDAKYLEEYVFYVDVRGYIALKPNATKNYRAFIEEATIK